MVARDQRNTHSYSTHFEQTCFERGLHSQFSVAYKTMLLPDAIPTIFLLSKKAAKDPTKKRGAFLKRERLRVSDHYTPMHNPVHFSAKQHVHTMLTVSLFMTWKHAVIFHIVSDFISWQWANIKTFNLWHYTCACFEFSFQMIRTLTQLFLLFHKITL